MNKRLKTENYRKRVELRIPVGPGYRYALLDSKGVLSEIRSFRSYTRMIGALNTYTQMGMVVMPAERLECGDYRLL